jgi:hypothetical protein
MAKRFPVTDVDVPFLLVLDHAKLTDPGNLKKWLEHVEVSRGDGLD